MALCGAKTRSGAPCKAKAMTNGRCRMHGGTNKGAPKGNKNKVSCGALYSSYYTDEEKALADGLELESIDAELRLCKIRLNRALKLEAEQTDETLELKQVVETPAVIGGVPVEDDEVSPVRQKTYAKKDSISTIKTATPVTTAWTTWNVLARRNIYLDTLLSFMPMLTISAEYVSIWKRYPCAERQTWRSCARRQRCAE